MTTGAAKPLRADAQRNRDRLLAVAVRALSDDPDVALEAIAKEAGVGIGTLYRHFPTREALIEAAYRSELLRLSEAAPALLAKKKPDAALRAWMDRFVDYMTAKRGMAQALQRLIESGGNPFAESRARMVGALASLLEAGAAAGTIRADVAADDVLTTLSGVTLAAGDPDKRKQAGRILDLVMDGLRAR